MIVMAIVAAVIGVGISRFDRRDSTFKDSVKNFKMLSRQIKTSSKLQNRTFRLVLDLGGPEGVDDHQYWVEKATDKGILFDDEDIEKKNDNDDEEDGARANFEKDESLLKGKMTMPKGVKFDSVEITGIGPPFKRDIVYIYYQPEGLVDESAIHISYGDIMKWTIAIHPLTAQVDIITKEISLKEIKDQ